MPFFDLLSFLAHFEKRAAWLEPPTSVDGPFYPHHTTIHILLEEDRQ